MRSRLSRSWSRSRRPMRRLAGTIAAVTGLALFAAASFIEQGCEKDAPKPAAAEPILVGVSFGLTGQLESLSAPLRDSVRVAEGEINAGGGLLGRPLRFVFEDDTSDEDAVVSGVANRLVDKGVVAVIGPVGSQQVVVTQKIFARARLLQISPTATSTDLTNIQSADDRFLFRTVPADDFQGAAVILFATKTPLGLGDGGAPMTDAGTPVTCNKLALVHIDNAYGNAMANVIADNFPRRGAGRTITLRKKVNLLPPSSYATDVAELVASGPECMAIVAYEEVAAKFIRDLKADPGYPALEQRGFFVIGTDGVYTSGFLKASRANPGDDTSASTAEGVYGTNPDTQPGTPEYNAFKTIYSSYFPLRSQTDAPAYTANAFDAAILIALAIQKAGTASDPVAIRDALRLVAAPPGRLVTPSDIAAGLIELREGRDVDYRGASGDVDLQPNGNVTSGFIVWQAVRNPQTKRMEYRTVARFKTEELVEQIR